MKITSFEEAERNAFALCNDCGRSIPDIYVRIGYDRHYTELYLCRNCAGKMKDALEARIKKGETDAAV